MRKHVAFSLSLRCACGTSLQAKGGDPADEARIRAVWASVNQLPACRNVETKQEFDAIKKRLARRVERVMGEGR